MKNKYNKLNEYNGQDSNFIEMVQNVNAFIDESKMRKQAEIERERQRSLNATNALKNAIESAYGRGSDAALATTYEKVKKSQSFPEIKATNLIPPRAVGPLEEIPASTLFQDSIMLKKVLANTQLKSEHTMRASLAMAKNLKPIARNREAFDAEGNLINGYAKGSEHSPGNYDNEKFAFKIHNTALGGVDVGSMGFPAYISNYSENNGASWDSLSFVNATEDSYVYQRGDRSFTLEFKMIITNKNDLNAIMDPGIPEITTYYPMTRKTFWEKLQFLNTLTRPKIDSKTGVIREVPFCRMTIGNFIRSQRCIIDGVAFNYDPLIWDLEEDKIAPTMVNITITGKYLHGVPNVDTQYYGVNYE